MRFEEGLILDSLNWQNGSFIAVGYGDVTKVVVAMQYGEMAMVPWAEVSYKDGRTNLVNLSTVDNVMIAPGGPDEQ